MATPTEVYLGKLCERAFLSLWSYLRPHKDQDKRELCDLLVLFDRDILIFSDKHCGFPDSGDLNTDWARWHRRSIGESWRQIRRAEGWLRNHPTRVFQDAACTQPLHIPVPVGDDVRIHRIVVVRGAAERCKALFGGGSGSMAVTNEALPNDGGIPFFLGIPEPGSEVFHVFDEVTLDILFQHLDTVADFVRYLRKKEELFKSHRHVMAPGEEELLAVYLKTLDEHGGHTFSFPPEYDAIGLEEGFWEDLLAGPQFAAWRAANEVSYSWDALTEKFIHHAVTRTQHYTSGSTVAHSESWLRWMAREPRVRRRMLARKLIDMIHSTPMGMRRATAFLPSRPGDPYWIFLVHPRPPEMSYEDYREFRRLMLFNYLYVVKLIRPEAEHICGLAVNSSVDDGMTEDGGYYDASVWTAEMETQARTMHEQHGLLKDVTWNEGTEWEFPLEEGE